VYKNFLVFLLMTILIFSGCLYSETARESSAIPANEYFYAQDTCLTADITTKDVVAFESRLSPNLEKTEKTNLNIYKAASMQKGSIYKLIIDPVENLDGYLAVERLQLYFYVTNDEIYRIWSHVYDNDALIRFSNNDDLLILTLDTEEKILNNSYLVCRKNAASDEKGRNDEPGMHNVIEIDGNRIKSRMWNVKQNGDTDFYEVFVWESGRGIVSYKSGFGAGRDMLYLTNISRLTD